MDHIEDLLEKSRTKQGEAREQIYKTLGRIFDVILDLEGISPAVDKAFGEHAKTVTGESTVVNGINDEDELVGFFGTNPVNTGFVVTREE